MNEIGRRDFLKGLGLAAGASLLPSCASSVAGLGVGLGTNGMPSLLIAPQQMARRLGGHFPVTKDYKNIAEVQFSDPVFGMVPELDKVRVGLTTAGGVKGLGQPLKGSCQLACGLRFDSKSRGIYLTNSELETFEIDGLSRNWVNRARELANIVGSEYLERYPVFTLPNTRAMRLLKGIDVVSNGVQLQFGI